jgi:hypothetical protein
MDPNLLVLLIAAALVLTSFLVAEIRLRVRRLVKAAYERGREAGARSLRALDMLLAQPEQPTKRFVLERPSGDLVLTIRAVTDGEVKFLQRTPQGMQPWELVSMAMTQPKMSANDLRRSLRPDEIAKLADIIMEFSGYGAQA